MALGRTMTGPTSFCFWLLSALTFWTPVLGDALLRSICITVQLPFY